MGRKPSQGDILLLFPPLGNHEHPHMGLPVLKGFIVKNGFKDCTIRDYNVPIMNRMFTDLLAHKPDLFGSEQTDPLGNYYQSKQIMKGTTSSDKLKSGVEYRSFCCKKQGYTRLRMNVHFWASLAWEKPRSSVEEGQILFQPLPLFRAKKPKSFLP